MLPCATAPFKDLPLMPFSSRHPDLLASFFRIASKLPARS
jgi:hypothetical protein